MYLRFSLQVLQLRIDCGELLIDGVDTIRAFVELVSLVFDQDSRCCDAVVDGLFLQLVETLLKAPHPLLIGGGISLLLSELEKLTAEQLLVLRLPL